MAHFVKLDENNIVVNGFAIHDNELKDNENNEQEILGIKFCVKLFGEGNYKQTFYDGTSRKNYAGVGYTYDETRDAFIGPKPYASWTLNETSCTWHAPVTYPSVTEYGDPAKAYRISWDESNTRWIATDQEDPAGNFRWDASASNWVSL